MINWGDILLILVTYCSPLETQSTRDACRIEREACIRRGAAMNVKSQNGEVIIDACLSEPKLFVDQPAKPTPTATPVPLSGQIPREHTEQKPVRK